MNNKIKIFLLCLAFFLVFSFKGKAFCEEYKLFTGVVHLDSTISGGKLPPEEMARIDRKSTRLNSSHSQISYAGFCLKKKNEKGTAALWTFEGNIKSRDPNWMLAH